MLYTNHIVHMIVDYFIILHVNCWLLIGLTVEEAQCTEEMPDGTASVPVPVTIGEGGTNNLLVQTENLAVVHIPYTDNVILYPVGKVS